MRNRTSIVRLVGGALVIAMAVVGCADQSTSDGSGDGAARLLELTDEFMAYLLDETPYLQMMAGLQVTRLPKATFEDAEAGAKEAQALLDRLATIDPAQLEHNDQMTYAMFKGLLEQAVDSVEFFWHSFNVTPYAVGNGVGILIPGALSTATFDTAEDVDRYLGLLEEVARYLDDDLARLRGQEERGILLPQAAIPGARTALAGFVATATALADVSEERTSLLEDSERTRLAEGIRAAVDGRIQPASDALQSYLGDDYVARAPEAVGMSQYPGGAEAYRFAIRQQTTLDLEPSVIHERGLEFVAALRSEMAEIRKELGFEGTQQEFHEQMRSDPRFFAESPEEVAERYMSYVRRIEPHIADYFSVMPQAPYGVERLDPAAEPGMTFGFYEAPSPSKPIGNYRFNGSKLESRAMVWTAGLIYHELIPGHHFHIALARENEDASEFRKTTALLYAAFTEGWANYAASLAHEMGLMEDPWDRYGWLLFDSFIATRLVVDTGMNHHGWPLEKARQYMRDNTFSSDEEIATETLRYSTDMPAQALAYKLGFERIRELRAAQEAELGDDFDIKLFHAATVGSGGMPMPLLEEHVNWVMSQ